MHGDLCKHLGIDSSTDHPDRYSNLFLNAYFNSHVNVEYLKMILFYSPLGMWHIFVYSINTDIYHFRSMKYRQYALIPPNQRIHLLKSDIPSAQKTLVFQQLLLHVSETLMRCAK